MFRAALLFLLAAAMAVCAISLWNNERKSLLAGEPYFKSPVLLKSSFVPIRNDAFGKGSFGVSRNGKRRHKGIDVLAALRTPILASKSGRVSFAGWDKGYGHYVEILHPDGLYTRYAHLIHFTVHTGQWVNQGSLIGFCGKTGNANDRRILPHVHFEIRAPQDALNPFRGLLEPKLSPK